MHPKPNTLPSALNFKLLPCPKKSLVARLYIGNQIHYRGTTNFPPSKFSFFIVFSLMIGLSNLPYRVSQKDLAQLRTFGVRGWGWGLGLGLGLG